MEIKDIEKVLLDALQAPEDETVRNKYCSFVADYLKGEKSSEEIVSIVIRGIELDQAANYFDFLVDESKSDLQGIWKQIRQNRELKDGKKDNSLAFLSRMLSISFMKVGNMECLCGNIITAIVEMISDEKNTLSVKIYGPIICDCFLDDLNPKCTLPDWESIRASEKTCQQFAEILLKATDGERADQYKIARIWANKGLRYAEEQIKKKEIEAKIPKSKIEALTAIVDHYKAVEKQLHDEVYKEASLQADIAKLNREKEALQKEKITLEGQICKLNADMIEKQQQLDKAEKEVGERTEINEAFSALKKNDESALLQDIANELKAEYQDFVESASDQMDNTLGEIYRDKLKNIFKILGKKGIKMG